MHFYKRFYYWHKLGDLNGISTGWNQNLTVKTVSFQKMSQISTRKSDFFQFYDYFSGLGMKITPDSDFSSNFTPRGVIFLKKFLIF